MDPCAGAVDCEGSHIRDNIAAAAQVKLDSGSSPVHTLRLQTADDADTTRTYGGGALRKISMRRIIQNEAKVAIVQLSRLPCTKLPPGVALHDKLPAEYVAKPCHAAIKKKQDETDASLNDRTSVLSRTGNAAKSDR